MRLLTFSLLLLLAFSISATTVRFETDYGNIDIEMNELLAPMNVENFLNYVETGAYDRSQIHRSLVGTLIQGGDLSYDGTTLTPIPENGQVVNEFNVSNTRGTVSMAKIANQPNSASNNWFINVNDNVDFDTQNEGFTVIGTVIRGMDVVDNINSLRVLNPFVGVGQDLRPFHNFQAVDEFITADNFVYINRAFVLSDTFQITEGISGAWVTPGINGQGLYIEVLPAANVMILAWFTFDTESPDPTVPSTIGDAGNRWLTGSGTYQDNLFTGSTFKTSGGLFDSFVSVVNIENGSVTIEFENCSNAIMSYILDDAGESNSIALQRVSGINVDFCEALATNAAPGIAAQ